MIFKNLCVLVICSKVASALEFLKDKTSDLTRTRKSLSSPFTQENVCYISAYQGGGPGSGNGTDMIFASRASGCLFGPLPKPLKSTPQDSQILLGRIS